MTDAANSEGPVAVPAALQKMQDLVPEFGIAWEMKSYQNPDEEGKIIMALIPPEGSGGKARYLSKIGIMTSKGPAEMGFTIIDAHTLEEAVAGWQASARIALAEMHEQLAKQQKRIIVPNPNAPLPGQPPFKKLVLNS